MTDLIQPGKAYTSTSIEIKSKDGCSKTVREEECENGYIITVDLYTPGTNGNESQWVTKKYISDKSVINKKQKEEEANLSSVLKELGYE